MIAPAFLPTPAQARLLAVVLAPDETGPEAFRAFHAGLDLDATDAGSYRLLPLLYRRLTSWGIEVPETAVLKGIYRQTLYHNMLLKDRAAKVVARLGDAGLPVTVLKGMPLADLYYPDLGSRPMGDVDFLVPADAGPKALALLAEMGWEAEVQNPERVLRLRHSIGLTTPDKLGVDLHIAPIFQAFWYPAGRAAMVAHPVPYRLGPVETQTLGPTEMLLHVLSHGAARNTCPPIRWVADAMLLLGVAGDQIDWDHFVGAAAALQVSPVLAIALEYLVEHHRAHVPGATLRALHATPTDPLARRFLDLQQVPANHWNDLRLLWAGHRLLRHSPAAAGAPRSFPGYIRGMMGLDSWSAVGLRIGRAALGLSRPPPKD